MLREMLSVVTVNEGMCVCVSCSVAVNDQVTEELHKQVQVKEEAEKVSLQDMEKEKEKRRKSSREVSGEEVEAGRRESRSREHRKVKKVPSKKVQKLHNLTGDLLFQVRHSGHKLGKTGTGRDFLSYLKGRVEREISEWGGAR